MSLPKWCKRILLVLPFAVAATLNVFLLILDSLHLRTEQIAGLGFLFAAPWGWLLDHDWFFHAHPARWVETLASFAVVLWIPALLYSLSLWILMRTAGRLLELWSSEHQ